MSKASLPKKSMDGRVRYLDYKVDKMFPTTMRVIARREGLSLGKIDPEVRNFHVIA